MSHTDPGLELSSVWLDQDRQVRSLVRDLFRQALAEGLFPQRPPPHDDSRAVLALAGNGRVAGLAVYYEVNDKRLWLDFLWVQPHWRRRGVGLQLMQAVEHAARHRKLEGVILGHAETNAPMIALAERAGWAVDHIVRGKGV
jgi:GNAT superfamily N-acetyltransferase